MHKYVTIGIQGSGKGTQAKLLKGDFDLVHISVGEILRWNIQHHTKLAARINRYVADGKLVPDELIDEIVQLRLNDHDWNYGFILDGFPRNRQQAEFFLECFDIDAVIHIQIPDKVVIERVLSRRLCSICKLDYNLIFLSPVKPDVCDICGGRLVTRPDDTEKSIRQRIKDYHEKTEPVLDLFARKELVIHVNGAQKPADVQNDMREKLGLFAPE